MKGGNETAKQLAHLAQALKAPRILECADRLASEATDLSWSFQDYLCAVLEREASARAASGAEQRIRSAGFFARKSLDDFDFDVQSSLRSPIAQLASGSYLHEARNIVLLGP